MAITTPKIDLNAWFAGVTSQFQGLNPKEPGQWPLAPKLAASLVVMIAVVVAGYVFVLSDVQAGLDASRPAWTRKSPASPSCARTTRPSWPRQSTCRNCASRRARSRNT